MVAIHELLQSRELLAQVSGSPNKHRTRVLVSKVCKRAAKQQSGATPNEISIERFAYGDDDSEYFYPASAIKLCVAITALQKFGRLRKEQAANGVNALTLDSPWQIFQKEQDIWLAADNSNVKSGKLTIGTYSAACRHGSFSCT